MDDLQNSNNIEQPLTKKQRKELKRQEKIAEQNKVVESGKQKRIVLWTGAILGVVLIILGIIKLASISSSTGEVKAVTDQDWIKGSRTAPATLIEYSDFECPTCEAYYPLLKQVQRDLGEDKLSIVYRHYPLTAIHPNADLAARAAEAAGKQNKFWEMHNLLFDRHSEWEKNTNAQEKFVSYAEELVLNKDQFIKDLNSKEVKDAIEEDIKSGNEARVEGTPTFFLNGKNIPLAQSYEEFKALIEQSINTSTAK